MSGHFVVVDLFPSLLQPEGDHGNAVFLAHRARQHGLDADVVIVHPGDEMPRADVVTLGGSMDGDAAACAQALRDSGVLSSAWASGAVVLGVGAGFCMLANTFVDVSGKTCHATGLLDVHMEPAALANGPVVTYANDALGLPPLSGYEFHELHAIRAAPVRPLAEVEVGVGDRLVGAKGKATDGAVGERVLGTWLHGPLLPRNPALAEMLLRWARPELAEDAANPAPMATREMDEVADSIRAQRMAAARRGASQ